MWGPRDDGDDYANLFHQLSSMLRLLVHYILKREDWEVPGNKKPLPKEGASHS